MSTLTTLREVLIVKLQVLFDVEEELLKALPKMAEAVTNMELKDALRAHLEETRVHVTRLKQALELLGEKVEVNESNGIRGIIADVEWIIRQKPEAALLDLMLAGAARYAEHYEMAGYMVAINIANLLEEGDVVDLLTETLDEEETADDKLETIAETELSDSAMAAE